MEHAHLSEKQDYQFSIYSREFSSEMPNKSVFHGIYVPTGIFGISWYKMESADVSELFPSISPASVTTNQVKNSSNHVQTRVKHA